MHPARWAPHHLACLPIEYLGRPPVLIFESLPARLEVDHHPVPIVLVKLSRHLIFSNARTTLTSLFSNSGAEGAVGMVARTAPNKSDAGCQVICMTGRIAYRLLKRKLSGLAERETNLPRTSKEPWNTLGFKSDPSTKHRETSWTLIAENSKRLLLAGLFLAGGSRDEKIKVRVGDSESVHNGEDVMSRLT